MNIAIHQSRIGHRIPVNGVIYNPTIENWSTTSKPYTQTTFATFANQRMESEFNARYDNFENGTTL